LEGDRPYFELRAGDEKNRQGTPVPLRHELAKSIRDWITECVACGSGPADPVFTVPTQLVNILNRDLALAGIEKADHAGRTIDVHALRHTFGTLLARAGAKPKAAQLAMRHSKIDLTMNTYTDPQLIDVAGAVESLPSLDGPKPVELTPATALATGTDGPNRKWAPKWALPDGHSGVFETTGEPSAVFKFASARKKTPTKQAVSRGLLSEAEGTRTPNNRIDSPAIRWPKRRPSNGLRQRQFFTSADSAAF